MKRITRRNKQNTKKIYDKQIFHRSSPIGRLTSFFVSFIFVFFFALWWFNPQHIPHNFTGIFRVCDVILFILVSFVIWHPIIMDVLTWFISLHIKDIARKKPVLGLKVAFITTIVPANEPLSLLHRCLPAMVKAKYPHDTWLLDESNDEAVKAICRQYGVHHFSRHGKAEFNTPMGKFTRTKGGNHNSWYEVYGNSYDIVAQIDTDFVPKSSFLTKTLGYFRNPQVGFVGTPQIYGNTKNSFIALGAAEQQYTFYGTVLRGLSGMGMTLLIGANHIVRVAALRDVNHYSAHITEDLLTGMKLHTKGWKSVYVPESLAIGEGPSSWEAYFNQQLRWAYGCMDILFRHSPRLLKKLSLPKALYYFLLQQHYFSGIAMACSILMLSLYFTFGIRAANVDMVKFFVFYSGIMTTCWLMSVWLQQFNIHREADGELFLAGKVVSVAAWPIWFLAFVSIVTKIKLKYKVTPKGEMDTNTQTSMWVFLPQMLFGTIALFGLLSSFFTHRQSSVMIFWAASSAIIMFCVPFLENIAGWVTIIRHYTIKFLQKVFARKNDISMVNSQGFSIFPPLPKKTNRSSNLYTIAIISDMLFLTCSVILSCVWYLPNIGFYSDDWSFLGNFTLSRDQSLIGLIRTATTPNTFMRPGQNMYDALLYWAFGTHPIGYQLVNAEVLIGSVLLLYCVLAELRIPRIIAISVPLLFSLLPQYATDRFWYASFQADMSIFLYFFSLYAGLRASSQMTRRPIFWRILSISSLLGSILNYEVAMPLVVVNLILFGIKKDTFSLATQKKKTRERKNTIFIIVTMITLGYLFLFKALTTTRLGSLNYPGDIIHIMSSVFYVNYWTWGIKLPYIWFTILMKYQNMAITITAGILYLVISWYLYTIISDARNRLPTRTWMRNLTMVSIGIFCLGYVIFFTNNKVGFSPTGIDNRVAIAAAIGIAFSLVGGFGWVSQLVLPEKWAKIFFANSVAVVCAGGFLIINTLSGFWITASQKQETVLADIHQAFPRAPRNATIILDGVCPYVGPGIVFESQWDLKGALQTIYHDPTIQADIVTPRLKLTNTQIRTQIYTFPTGYSYKHLYIYNAVDKQTYAIHSRQDALAYFQRFNPDYNNSCPPSSAGNGVSIF